jgi:hypothetical protein
MTDIPRDSKNDASKDAERHNRLHLDISDPLGLHREIASLGPCPSAPRDNGSCSVGAAPYNPIELPKPSSDTKPPQPKASDLSRAAVDPNDTAASHLPPLVVTPDVKAAAPADAHPIAASKPDAQSVQGTEPKIHT